MSAFKRVMRRLKWIVLACVALIVVFLGVAVFQSLANEEMRVAGESIALARQARIDDAKTGSGKLRKLIAQGEKKAQERLARFAEEDREREVELEKIKAKIASLPKNKKSSNRQVRRWKWMSPPEKIAQTWNVPKRETQDSEVTGLLRICTSEQEGSENDCIGIYQVISNIRSRSCKRDYFHLITECDDNGETLLSAMRRASRYVVGIVPARYARQRWIAQMTTECSMPKSYPVTVKRHCRKNLQECAQNMWNIKHRHHCQDTAKLVSGLIGGTNKSRITGARVIAWGGRCEVATGACDDPIACTRGLARVPRIEGMMEGDRPANAFWCRKGTPGCRADTDPICIAMGYGDDKVRDMAQEMKKAIEKVEALKGKVRRQKRLEDEDSVSVGEPESQKVNRQDG